MNVRSPTVALAVAVCLFGLSAGLFFNVLQAQGPQVTLEPSFVQLVEDPREYQPVSLSFQLHNPTSDPIVVRQASASCNCMNVVTRGGLPMLSPITIPPGGSLPWRVDLVTARRGGPEEYFFRIECLVNGQPKELSSRIAINVQAGWRADPPALSDTDVRPFDEVFHEVALFDGYGAKGFRVAEVRVSNPHRLTAELMPVDLSQQPTAKTLMDGGVNLPQRYRLAVTMRSGDEGELRQETITLVSGEPNHPNLEIPVSCRTKPRTYELIPATLVLVPNGSEDTIRRTIRCRIREGANPNLKVHRAPTHLVVGIRSLDEALREIEIVAHLNQKPADTTEEVLVFGVEGHDDPVFSLVVTYRISHP